MDIDNSNKGQQMRRKAVEFAFASVRLEGFSVSAKTLADSERFICGEISLNDFIAETNELA